MSKKTQIAKPISYLFRHNVKAAIRRNGTRVFGVTFRKVNGDLRSMQCHSRCTKGLSENPSDSSLQAVETRKRNHPNLVSVYDMALARQGKPAWRSVNLDTLVSVRMNGIDYRIIDSEE